MKPALDVLKELPFLVKDPATLSQRDFLSLSRFGGIAKGELTEISGVMGSGKTEAMLRLLLENPDLRVAWFEEDWTMYPPVFFQKGISPERLWCLELKAALGVARTVFLEVISSQVFGAVIIHGSEKLVGSEVGLRRLQIVAEKANVAVILLTETPVSFGGWCLRRRYQVQRSNKPGQSQIEILRDRI